MNNSPGGSPPSFIENPLVGRLWKICRYCISGGTGAITDFLLYSLLIWALSLNYLVANLISFTCGTLVTYYLQKNWTFRYGGNDAAAVFRRFILAVIGTYALNSLLLFTFVDLLHLNVYLAKVLQIILSTIWGYSINSLYVFREKERGRVVREKDG